MSAQVMEIRRYVARPGRRGELASYMDRVVIPFVKERGVTVDASSVDQNDDDAYIWIRTFDSEAERAEKYRLIYENPSWRSEIEPIVRDLMDFEKAVITTARPTETAG